MLLRSHCFVCLLFVVFCLSLRTILRCGMGDVYIKVGKSDLALIHYKEAQRLNPSNTVVIFLVGIVSLSVSLPWNQNGRSLQCHVVFLVLYCIFFVILGDSGLR